jgi:undecaprenyl-diphosphatase
LSTDVASTSTRPRRPRRIEDAERLDLALYAVIARTPTSALEVAMSRPPRAADYSRLSSTSAALVAYSRVHTGVHYPEDVLAGALIGTALAQLTTHALARRRLRRVARVRRGL